MNNRRWLSLAKPFLIVVAVQIALSIILMLVAFPTERHRDVNRELSQSVSNPMIAGKLPGNAAPEVKQLSDTQEHRYSYEVQTAGSMVDFILTIIMTYLIYRYIRQRRIAGDAVSATVVVFVTATLTSMLVGTLAGVVYGTEALPSILHALASLTIGIIPILIWYYILARISKWHYDRKHNFEVE